MQAMKMSFRPRFFRSVRHDSQNLAPSCFTEPEAQKFLAALQIHAQGHVHRVRRHPTVVATHMHDDAVEIDDRPDRVELPGAPRGHLRVEVGGDLRDQRRRHIDVVEFFHDLLNVASGHPLGVEGKNLLVEPAQPALMFWDQLRLEGAIAVARRRDLDLAEIALHGLSGMAVATILRTRFGQRFSKGIRNPSAGESPRDPPWQLFAPRWTSISVSSMRSRAEPIMSFRRPFSSSSVFACEAISRANCSALPVKIASMRQSP